MVCGQKKKSGAAKLSPYLFLMCVSLRLLQISSSYDLLVVVCNQFCSWKIRDYGCDEDYKDNDNIALPSA